MPPVDSPSALVNSSATGQTPADTGQGRSENVVGWHFSASDWLRSLPLLFLLAGLGLLALWVSRRFGTWALPIAMVVLLSPVCAWAGQRAQRAFHPGRPGERLKAWLHYVGLLLLCLGPPLGALVKIAGPLWQRDLVVRSLTLPGAWAKALILVSGVTLAHGVIAFGLLHAGRLSLPADQRRRMDWTTHLSALVNGAGIVVVSLGLGLLVGCLMSLGFAALLGKSLWLGLPLLGFISLQAGSALLGLVRLTAALGVREAPISVDPLTRVAEHHQELALSAFAPPASDPTETEDPLTPGEADLEGRSAILVHSFQGLRSRGEAKPVETLVEAEALLVKHPHNAGLLLEVALLYQRNDQPERALNTAAAAICRGLESGAFPIATQTLTAFSAVRHQLQLTTTTYEQLHRVLGHQQEPELAEWCAAQAKASALES